MALLGWVALVVAVLSLIAWRLTYAAARLDRLHARVEGTAAALDAQLVRRAEASLELARCGELDPLSAVTLGGAATESLEAADAHDVAAEVRERGLAPDREDAENQLSGVLAEVLTPSTRAALVERDGPGAQALTVLGGAARRVQLSRRFHNDAVSDVRRMRGTRMARWFHLAGHTELPSTVEFDDGFPGGR